MKGNLRLIAKQIYNALLFLYLISIGIVAYITKTDFMYFYFRKMFSIFGVYLLLGGIISIIFKINLITPKLQKFNDVDRNHFDFNSYVTAIVIIIMGICFTILFGFIQFN